MPAQVIAKRFYIVGSLAMLLSIVALFMALSGCGGALAFAASGSCPVGDTETFAGNPAFQSGTAFTMTFDHAATANRTVTYPDTTGTVALQNQTLSTGALPSSVGAIRMSNNEQVYVRNAANTANNLALQIDTADRILIGATTNDPANTELRNNSAAFVFNNGTELARLTTGGQWQMGQTTDPGTTSNTAHVYAKDDAGTARVYVRDEDGTTSRVSPHDPNTNHWVFYSCNAFKGECIEVDMEVMVAALEAFTGRTFLTRTQLPANQVLNWDADQARLASERATEIAKWDAAPVKDGPRPTPYLPRLKPDWLK